MARIVFPRQVSNYMNIHVRSDIPKIDISYLSSENLMVFLIFIADIIFQV